MQEQEEKVETKNLKAYDELLLLINVEIVEFVELFIKNPNEPFLEVRHGGMANRAISIRIIMLVLMKIGIWGGGGIGEVLLEDLLEGLVAEKLVSPLRESLLQVGLELLPEFHYGFLCD